MPHRQNFAELLFFTKGGGVHEIDFNEQEFNPNAIHFIPKSTVHFLNRSITSDGFTIAFDTDYLEHNVIDNSNMIFVTGKVSEIDSIFIGDISNGVFKVLIEN